MLIPPRCITHFPLSYQHSFKFFCDFITNPKPIKMKAVCVALFALFAVTSGGLLAAPAPAVYASPVLRAAPVAVAAPVLRAAPFAVAAVPAYRASPVLAASPVAYGASPVYGGLGGVTYGGAILG